MERTEFYIKSYWAAAWLYSHNIKPNKITLTPKGRRLFFYDNTDEINDCIQEFYDNQEYQSYVRACSELKTEMFKATARAEHAKQLEQQEQ